MQPWTEQPTKDDEVQAWPSSGEQGPVAFIDPPALGERVFSLAAQAIGFARRAVVDALQHEKSEHV